jgi:glucose-1-phosphate thymidylyltransferase
MKLIILAAGYATRLYPLTLNQPKSLLTVAGKPMIDHVLDCLSDIEDLDEALLVTNSRFCGHFQRWIDAHARRPNHIPCTLVNDQSTSELDRLGAIGDLQFALTKHAVQEDIIVVAADNLFSASLAPFGSYCRKMQTPVLATYDVGDIEQIRKYNALSLDAEGRIVFFEEKPVHPKSTLTGIALYYYPESCLPLISQYMTEGNNPDQPGRLIQWLYPRIPVYTWQFHGRWYDIGSVETLNEAERLFTQPDAGKRSV